MTRKRFFGTAFYYVAAILLALIALVPFAWMISTSFKSRGALMSIPIEWIPEEPTLDAYFTVFERFPFLRAIGNKYIFLLIVNVILLIAGCFIDANSAMYIIVPILTPVAAALDIDLVHLGCIMVFNLAVGLVTPPVGVNLYVGCGIAGIKLKSICKSVMPLIIAAIIALLLVTYVEPISMILPNLIGGNVTG